jgi:hypothetical protein
LRRGGFVIGTSDQQGGGKQGQQILDIHGKPLFLQRYFIAAPQSLGLLAKIELSVSTVAVFL